MGRARSARCSPRLPHLARSTIVQDPGTIATRRPVPGSSPAVGPWYRCPAMCGIFGGVAHLVSEDAEQLLQHRGPDQHGRVTVTGPDGHPVVIGQTRLNIVYKKNVPTPMQRDGAAIAFNGEIYNWGELRRELETKGWEFRTPTDTEVVLCAYLEWGP